MKYLLSLALVCAGSLHAATQITWKRIQLHGDFYSEGAGIGDINGDGKPDIVAGPFWWEGPAFEKKHAYYEPKIFSINGYSDNFFAYVHDFNGDKKNDILILGFPGKEARLYLNPGGVASDAPWEMHIVADVVDNESPVLTDITGDGKPEIVCSTGGKFGWFAPNWEKPTEKWPFVAISDDMKVAKFTHGLGVGDVNGDGKLDLLEARRWWEQPAGPAISNSKSQISDFTKWTQHNFAAGVGGGAQMFAYDFDGNGTNDVFTALAAHRYGVAVFLQNKRGVDLMTAPTVKIRNAAGVQELKVTKEFNFPREFEPGKDAVPATAANPGATWNRVMLASEQPQDNDYGIVFSQPHAAHLADINGDGIQDIVVGKRYWAHNGKDPDERGARVVYWYETKRDGKGGVDFVPHLVDANSGVGTDVQVGDVNGDGLPDIVTANKAGVFVLLQERKEISAADAQLMEPKKMYGPALKPQADYAHGLSPQDALKAIQLPGGFKAELIAAEPDIVQPIAFTFDERGRIWVLEGLSYPQPREPGKGQDRIVILEDKDGDGTFETKKVFCEGISLGSGIELGFGGVWVGAAPYLMFIPRDGDATVPVDGTNRSNETYATYSRVPGLGFTAYALLDGWGSQDTHETLNSFIWGPDGWLYGCHGVFTHSRVGKPGTPDDQRTPINAGVWRYHPVRHVFAVFAHGTSNPWGLDYDQNGEFFVTACVIPHLFHIVPGGRYQRQAGPHFNPHTYEDIKTIADHAHYSGNLRPDVTFDRTTGAGVVNNDTNALGGGHAHCGLAIYQSSQFPQTYRGALIFGNLHGHRLVMDYLDENKSTYTGKHGSDFMRSNDMNFIPVTQKVGPDGALYVSDWSDKQICHRGSGAVELWDRSNGRIYRVSYGSNADTPVRFEIAGADADKSVRITAPFDLAKESDESLAKLAVQTENEWFSRMARRVLMERAIGKDLIFDKKTRLLTSFALLLESLPKSAPDSETQRALSLRTLWAFSALGLPTDIGGEFYSSVKNDEERVWSIRLMTDDWTPERPTFRFMTRKEWEAIPSKGDNQAVLPSIFDTTDFAGHISSEGSPIVRREAASMLQRMPTTARRELARALLAHGEDKDDPYIPLLIWYGIEPVVGADAKLGLELAKASKMPKVTEFIYRRLAAEPEGRLALLRLLAAETAPKPLSGGGEAGKGGRGAQKSGSPIQKGGPTIQKGGSIIQKGGSPIQKVGAPIQKGGSPIQKVSAPIQKVGAPIEKVSVPIEKVSAPIEKVSAPIEKVGAPIQKVGAPIAEVSAPIAKVGGDGGVTAAPPGRFSPAEREQLLRAIVTAARSAGSQPAPEDWAGLSDRLRAGASPAFAALVDELGALYGDAGVLRKLRDSLTSDRGRALPILVQVRDKETAPLLIGMLSSDITPGAQREIVQALAILQHPQTPAVLIEKFAGFDAITKQDAVNTLATSAAGARALLAAVKAKTIPTTMLSPFLARQIDALDDAEVRALLKETFGDINAPKADLEERKKKFRPLLKPADLAKADVAKGRVIYSAVCGQCHKLFGEGQNVGPDLTGSNRGTLDYILDNVLDPNAVIGKDYQLNIFELKDGRVASGVVKEESAAAYRIAMPGGLEQTVTAGEVKKRTISKLSTMPEGLFDALPAEQLQQLVAYLQSNAGAGRMKDEGGRMKKVEGAIEGETLKVIEVKGGAAKLQGMAGFGGRWSGGQQLWWTGGKPGSTLTLALPVAAKGKYQLKAVLTKARDYGICDIALDGKAVATNFDGYNPDKVILTDELDWGTHDLEAGEHKLTFTITGANPGAVKSFMVGLDYVKLEKR